MPHKVWFIEPVLQKSKDSKIGDILNLEQVYFLMTRINCHKYHISTLWYAL